MSIEPVPIEQAEAHAGKRLDRRRRYAWDGEILYERARYSTNCSGCSCDCGDGYPCSHGASGCRECGFTGRRRHEEWFPYGIAESTRTVEREYHRARKVAP